MGHRWDALKRAPTTESINKTKATSPVAGGFVPLGPWEFGVSCGEAIAGV